MDTIWAIFTTIYQANKNFQKLSKHSFSFMEQYYVTTKLITSHLLTRRRCYFTSTVLKTFYSFCYITYIGQVFDHVYCLLIYNLIVLSHQWRIHMVLIQTTPNKINRLMVWAENIQVSKVIKSDIISHHQYYFDTLL